MEWLSGHLNSDRAALYFLSNTFTLENSIGVEKDVLSTPVNSDYYLARTNYYNLKNWLMTCMYPVGHKINVT